VPLTGGTFTGPELNGKLLPGSSADWQIVLPTAPPSATSATRSRPTPGDLLSVQSRGVRHGTADVLEHLPRGEDVDAAELSAHAHRRHTYAAVLPATIDGIRAHFGNPTQITLLRMLVSVGSLHEKTVHNGGSGSSGGDQPQPLSATGWRAGHHGSAYRLVRRFTAGC